MPLAIAHLQNAFQWTWQNSAQASPFVCLVLLVLSIWGRRLPPLWRLAFGFLILARLMIPVLPESSFSYLNLVPTKQTPSAAFGEANPAPRANHSHALPPHSPTSNAVASISSLPSTSINISPPPTSEGALRPSYTIQASSPAGIRGISYESLAENGPAASKLHSVGGSVVSEFLSIGGSIVWLLGMLFLITNTLIRRNRLLRRIKNLPPLPGSSVTGNIHRQCLAKLGFPRAIPIVECSQIETATVFGFLRPVILVSPQLEKNFSSGEIRNILLHELAHIQRADILWNWLAFAVQTVHWFNPLIYLATRRFRADRELACDARVLKCLSNDEHQQYGNTLIKIAEINTNPPFRLNPALAPFFHRKSEIKNRITMIAKPTKINKLTHLSLALLVGLVVSVTFTRAADDQPERPRDTPKQRKERTGKPECADCEKTQTDKPSPPENKRGEPQPERTERKGRPPHPPEGREPQDMPAEAREFAERVRGFHQKIGNLHREGNSEAARNVQEELHAFIQDHAELARSAGPAIHGPGGRPGINPVLRPPAPGADMEHVKNELRKASRPTAPSPKADMEHVKNELRKAKSDGRHEDAERLHRHLEEMERHHAERPGRQDNKPGGEGREIARRIEHIRLAAENLEQAGMHEQARDLHQQAEKLESEFQLQKEPEKEHHQEMRIDQQEKQIDLLKKENEKLKGELRKIENR